MTGKFLEKTEIEFRCPLCEKKFSARKIDSHLKREHPGMTKPQFIALLRQAKEDGKSVVRHKRVVLKGVTPSPQTAFSTGAIRSAKYVTLVPGGAVGLGKKR